METKLGSSKKKNQAKASFQKKVCLWKVFNNYIVIIYAADTASVVSIDKALRSDKLILITAALCALSWVVRHDSALLIIIIPFIFAAIGRLGECEFYLPFFVLLDVFSLF